MTRLIPYLLPLLLIGLTLLASQYSWPKKGIHFRLFLPMLTVRGGTTRPST